MANMLPLVLLAGATAVLMSKKKKKKNGKKCPSEVAMNPMTTEGFKQLAQSEYENRGGDPVGVANVVFKKLIPAPCTKKDYTTTIFGEQISGGTDMTGWNLAMVYAALVSAVLEVNINWDDDEAVKQGRRTMDQIATWYSQLTGEPLPDID